MITFILVRRFRKALYTLCTMYILHNLIVDGCRLNACRLEGVSRGRLLIYMSYSLRYLLLRNDGAHWNSQSLLTSRMYITKMYIVSLCVRESIL
jgi:hypothetical protein